MEDTKINRIECLLQLLKKDGNIVTAGNAIAMSVGYLNSQICYTPEEKIELKEVHKLVDYIYQNYVMSPS
jgi:hypothetical protein